VWRAAGDVPDSSSKNRDDEPSPESVSWSFSGIVSSPPEAVFTNPYGIV
jgi:hypothetical protein